MQKYCVCKCQSGCFDDVFFSLFIALSLYYCLSLWKVIRWLWDTLYINNFVLYLLSESIRTFALIHICVLVPVRAYAKNPVFSTTPIRPLLQNLNMATTMEIDDDECDLPTSSSGKGEKKRFEVKKVSKNTSIDCTKLRLCS